MMTTKIKELLDKIIDGKELRRQFEVKGSDERGPSAMAAVANVCMARGDDYQTLDAALDLVWEKLNTGHWRSVNADWRSLYALVVLAKVRKVSEVAEDDRFCGGGELIKDLVKMCDMGLLMGGPVMENACGRLASALSGLYASMFLTERSPRPSNPPKRAKTTAPEIPFAVTSKIKTLKAVEMLSLEDFIVNHMNTETPVVVSGMMSEWPCLSCPERKWTTDYIRKIAGLRTVPVEIGARYTDTGWTQKLMTVGEFIDGFVLVGGDSTRGYLAQHNLLDQVKELREDIEVPEYCYAGDSDIDDIDINGWFGPQGTVSPLHHDPKHNFLCQVAGKKYVRLYRRDQSDCLYPFDDELLFNTSTINIEKPDLAVHPKFAEAEGFECILEEGQMLYIPPKCWHFVKSLTPSFSLSFWFQ